MPSIDVRGVLPWICSTVETPIRARGGAWDAYRCHEQGKVPSGAVEPFTRASIAFRDPAATGPLARAASGLWVVVQLTHAGDSHDDALTVADYARDALESVTLPAQLPGVGSEATTPTWVHQCTLHEGSPMGPTVEGSLVNVVEDFRLFVRR